MNIIQSQVFTEVKIFEPKAYHDDRGFFSEVYNNFLQKCLGVNFVQDNLSKSCKNVLRGIHYQSTNPMGKLCRVIKGGGLDIMVDLRKNSSTFGKHEIVYLDEKNFRWVWVPEGFGHAFLSLQDDTYFYYKCSSLYHPNSEGSINIFSPELKLNLPLPKKDIILSEKDKNAPFFAKYKLNPTM
tara:strand:- start:335 stop:883 length:549 start_codon:yes stop_codon:yes gene_type:complete